MLPNAQLSLIPLGAGDLIDRAVRLYRKNFWTFVLIASPPMLVGTLFLVGWTMLGRSIFVVNSSNQIETGFYQLFIYFGTVLIWIVQTVAVLVVMGGASRSFVRNLLFGEPITFRETYKNSKKRFGGLILTSTLIVVLLGIFAFILFYLVVIVGFLGGVLISSIFGFSTVLLGILLTVFVAAVVFGGFWLFFLVVSRFVYVPQIMLVEGQGAMSAISRSAMLAGKNVKRIAALFIFTIVATYSALALLFMPLGWYAWANGVDFFAFDAADSIPAWYQIGNQVVSQFSLILLTPIWMIGLCLLYIDERVRKEGYDIELMASRRLGEIPDVSAEYLNPLQPALSDKATPSKSGIGSKTDKNSSMTTLGLD